MKRKEYVADLETTTYLDENGKTRAWASCLVDIDTAEVVDVWNNLEDFMDFLSKRSSVVYFHNLKFDAEFVISWLLHNGFECNDSKQENTFNVIISNMSVFYKLEIYFKAFNKRYHKCEIYDSYKKLPFSAAKIAKDFELEETKGTIDYDKIRPEGYEPTDEEKEYIINDCVIVAKALKAQFELGLRKMTIGSDAMAYFKQTIGGQKAFEALFPVFKVEYDTEFRQAFKGGFTYLNPKYKNVRIKEGLVFDVNSLYPWAMRECDLPYGIPVKFDGKYEDDERYPLYIQKLKCSFELKENKIPTLQLKNNMAFMPNQYLETSNSLVVELFMTNVDLELFLEHYYVQDLEYIYGYKFRSCKGIFNKYIDYWMSVKETSTGAKRLLAKLMLNNLYGKFSTDPRKINKYPVLEDGVVRYVNDDMKVDKPVYIPMGCFITAYARKKTITTAQKLYSRYIYSDTDSIHIAGYDIPDDIIDIHPTHLGAWKNEGSFTDSIFLRAKTYLETIDGVLNVTCAGMPDDVKELVTYENFTYGATYHGKLLPKRHAGGVILTPTDFTIALDI